MKRRWSFIIAGIVAAIVIPLFITSCYKDYGLDTLDYDVVVTNYDPAADFPSKNTYSMPLKITVIEDPNGPDLSIDPAVQKYIFDKIRVNMSDPLLGYGYTEVADTVSHDISIQVAASKSDYYYYYSGCWPYYGYTYCWDYPYYGGGYYDYAFTAGSLFIQMVDTSGVVFPIPPPPPDQEVHVSAIWLSGINGIVDDYQSSSLEQQQRIEARIDQAFAQSPYLKH